MKVIIQSDAASAARLTAQIIAKELRTNPSLKLGLATGRTMEAVYAELVELHRQTGLDFAHAKTFNLDEYAGLAPESPNSFRHYMNSRLFQRINIRPAHTHLPDGMADDAAMAGVRYEKLIARAGGIDLQLLGIGENGHIGFNEPLSGLLTRTRRVALSPATIAQNSPLFDNPEHMPRQALTMGIGTILDSKYCLLLATGQNKAAVIARSIEGPITAMVPASALQMHGRCLVILDEDAASGLERRDDYRELFASQPEWTEFR
jgi:glucosamine-6-phosphate deaminase